MPGYQYLDNGPRMDAIQQIGQTGGGLATALPQLQMQAQAFRQRLALQRAQELLNQQRMQESQARAKLYEGEMKLKETQGEETKARTSYYGKQSEEAGARTEHVKGQESREKDIATAAMMMGQALAQRYQAQQMQGQQGPPSPEQDATMNAIQAASLLSAKNPNTMGQFMGSLQGQPHNVPPGNVMVSPQGQPLYTNMQSNASQFHTLAPGAELFQGNQPVATNTNVKASSGGLGPAAQAILDRMKGGKAATPANAQASPAASPSPGTLYKGYRFKGGDPAQQQNWEKAE